ncbi:MAG: hypothetical protein ACLTKG_06865 [Collinsella intestinalis]
MAITTQERKEALAAAAEQELKGLEARGVRMAGNAFSPVVLAKASSTMPSVRAVHCFRARTARPCVRRSCHRLGAAGSLLAAVAGSGDEAVAGGLTAVSRCPSTCSARRLRRSIPRRSSCWTMPPIFARTYADALAIVEDFDTAMLKPAHCAGSWPPCARARWF